MQQRGQESTAIVPYYEYSRQDRVIKNNNMQSALSAKLVTTILLSFLVACSC
ncbi:MAG: ribose-phosphate pyrophosphokinase-like domain-containing protein [Wolbachia endosymbiont of Armadillidium vulgare]|nr:ribose-phosphate pyrophosphokinase-like domain-containing protein [Wolbachia endosymbiont of Armadillidium vulgare]